MKFKPQMTTSTYWRLLCLVLQNLGYEEWKKNMYEDIHVHV